MDFDEYEYLEKTVENPELQRKEKTNGSDGTVKADEKRDHSRSSKHKASEKHDDVDRHSKKLKSGDDSHGYDNHKERGSSQRRSPSRDGDKEKDRHRSIHDNRDRMRDQDRDKEEKYSRVRDKHREREHDRERNQRDRGSESERERERDNSRRSRSMSERLWSDLDERDRDRSRDRDYRDRERTRDNDYRERERGRESRERDKDSRRHKEKKEEAAEPEADPERDQRTVFAYQISLKADERDVYEFFSRAGKVRDVRLIMDRNSRRSKGVGYIEFYDVMSVPMAIALSGQPLLGQPVMVKPSEAEKNLVQSTASVSSGSTGLMGPYTGGARRLYVGNLYFSITEPDLRRVFEAFGQVEAVQLPLDESGHCKGFGFVQFARLEDARNAQSLNGQLEIGGRTIKVSTVIDQTGMEEVGGNTADFDDDAGGGLSLNACSRALLMQKLDRSGTGPGITGSLGNSVANNSGLNLPATAHMGDTSAGSLLVSPIASVPSAAALPGGSLQIPTATAPMPTIDTIGAPSECLLLKNMFDPNDEEPDFDLDIKEDVEAECSKFGKLRHVYVDKNTAGFVYLRFENTQAATNAQRSLHGRWFAGKMITASFMVPQVYEDKFQDSR
ncbi:RNA-binding protein 39 isoform X2 [Neltuma alba]|uniref:RNA-binding protein 39 isoform X2 n=1 Tax=Neltuma alba TaxID=207710 RepID=UPI0010A32706|nr:RNA-binding protein 39 isoform X2 [Prosopis alba]